MLRRVVLVRTDIAEERSASIIRVARMCELGPTLAVTSNWRMLGRNTAKNRRNRNNVTRNQQRMHTTKKNIVFHVTVIMEARRSTETSVLTRATRGNIPEDGIFTFLSWFTSCLLMPLIAGYRKGNGYTN
jgi:hypothetical protein